MDRSAVDSLIQRLNPLPWFDALNVGAEEFGAYSISGRTRNVVYSTRQAFDVRVIGLSAPFLSPDVFVRPFLVQAGEAISTQELFQSEVLLGHKTGGNYVRRFPVPLYLKAGEQLGLIIQSQTASLFSGRLTLVGVRLPRANS